MRFANNSRQRNLATMREGATSGGILKRLIRATFRGLGYFPARVGGVPHKVDPYHIGFWRSVSQGRWERHTFEILDEFLNKDSTFVDVGAWIGPLALFAATRSRQVFCIEPDYHAYQCLLMNLGLNGLKNVMPFNLALGSSTGSRRMSVMGGQMGNSLTRLAEQGQGAEQFEVPGISWSDWLDLASPGRPSLIKIDIEGGEFELLPAMKDYLLAERPPLLLSLHLPFLPEEQRDGRLGGLLDVVSIYKSRFDERRQRIGFETLAERARENVMSVLLVD